MNSRITTQLRRLAMIAGRLLAIELFLPGGTLIVLACLLTGRRPAFFPPSWWPE